MHWGMGSPALFPSGASPVTRLQRPQLPKGTRIPSPPRNAVTANRKRAAAYFSLSRRRTASASIDGYMCPKRTVKPGSLLVFYVFGGEESSTGTDGGPKNARYNRLGCTGERETISLMTTILACLLQVNWPGACMVLVTPARPETGVLALFAASRIPVLLPRNSEHLPCRSPLCSRSAIIITPRVTLANISE